MMMTLKQRQQVHSTENKKMYWDTYSTGSLTATLSSERRERTQKGEYSEYDWVRRGRGRGLPCRQLVMDISFPNLAEGTCDVAFRTYRGRICAHFTEVAATVQRSKITQKGRMGEREENSWETKENKIKKHNQSGETVIIRGIIIWGEKLYGCETASLPEEGAQMNLECKKRNLARVMRL